MSDDQRGEPVIGDAKLRAIDPGRSSTPSHWYWLAVTCSVGLLCLLLGFVTTVLQVFPYHLFESTFLALGGRADAPQTQLDLFVRLTPSELKSYQSGVIRYDSERAFDGYTLVTSTNSQDAYLLNMQGEAVHRWHLPFQQVWNPSAAVTHPVTADRLFWFKAYLYPNGDLLAVYNTWTDALWGYGLVKMNSESKPIWSYLERVHHDVTVGRDGRVYTLVQQERSEPVPEIPDIVSPSAEDFVVVLSPDGKLLKRVSLYDAVARSKYRGVTALLRNCVSFDTFHTNSVEPMPPSFSGMFPDAGPNTVLVSFRHLDSIALVDLDAVKVVWLMHGPFARQHDAEFLPGGHMMMFDDQGDMAATGRSRVIEFEPQPFKIVWQFPNKSDEKLDSELMGAAQKLPNGNVLITESTHGRMLEVTPDEKVVWEYRSPFRRGEHRELVADLNWGHRFAASELKFPFNQIRNISHQGQKEARNVQ